MSTKSGTHQWKRAAFWTILIIGSGILGFVCIELGARFLVVHYSGMHKSYLQFKEEALEQQLTIAQYAKSLDYDPLLGWGEAQVRSYVAPSSDTKKEEPLHITFFGDSVTAGHGVDAGREDYVTLFYERFGKLLHQRGGRDIVVTNLAVNGYGIDQMYLKLRQKAAIYRPDVVVIAFIPHDLIRPSNDFLGRTKPKFVYRDGSAFVRPAGDNGIYYSEFERALNSYGIAAWFLRRIWENKEYNFPTLFRSSYEHLFLDISDRLVSFSKTSSSTVILVKLSNTFKFRGDEMLTSMAGSIFREKLHTTTTRYVDLDQCVRDKSRIRKVLFQEEFHFHPGVAGHQIYADCMVETLDALKVWQKIEK